MTDIEILALLVKAKELGITLEDVDAFRDRLGNQTICLIDPVPDMKAEDIVKPMTTLDDLSEDEVRFWATPHFDEIQARKEAQKQKLKESI